MSGVDGSLAATTTAIRAAQDWSDSLDYEAFEATAAATLELITGRRDPGDATATR